MQRWLKKRRKSNWSYFHDMDESFQKRHSVFLRLTNTWQHVDTIAILTFPPYMRHSIFNILTWVLPILNNFYKIVFEKSLVVRTLSGCKRINAFRVQQTEIIYFHRKYNLVSFVFRVFSSVPRLIKLDRFTLFPKMWTQTKVVFDFIVI